MFIKATRCRSCILVLSIQLWSFTSYDFADETIIFYGINFIPIHFFTFYFIAINLFQVIVFFKKFANSEEKDTKIVLFSIIEVLLLINTIVILQAIFINLKIGGQISWAWIQIFVLVQIFLMISLMICLMLICDLLIKIYKYLKDVTFIAIKEIKLNGWITLVLTFIVTLLFLNLLNFLSYMDNGIAIPSSYIYVIV